MAIIEWGPEFELGIEIIDNDHRVIVKHLNELQLAMMFGKGKDIIGEILNGITAYAMHHFKTEERYMLEFCYPGYSEHKAQHEFFLKKVREFYDKLRAGNAGLTLEVFNFLRDWLEAHVQNMDRKYVACFNEHGL